MESDSQDEIPPVWYIGLYDISRARPASQESVQLAQHANYDMLTSPITTPHFQSRVQALLSTYHSELLGLETHRDALSLPVIPALTPADSTLTPHESIAHLIGVTSSWIDLCSPDKVIASLSLQVFNLEVAYAAFCGIQNVVVPGPFLPDGSVARSAVAQFARVIDEAVATAPYIHFQILLPMQPVSGLLSSESGHLSNYAIKPAGFQVSSYYSHSPWATWEAWDSIRTVCKYHSRVSLALVTPKSLPTGPIQARWFSEPIKVLVFPNSTFIPNKHSQPVLSKSHQTFLSRFMRLKSTPWILLYDVGPVPHTAALDPTPRESTILSQKISSDPTPHLSYFRVLQVKQPPKPPIERFGAGYQDFLQMPLQPLADNLESVTYEVFEKDPIKYEWYEQAICNALSDWNHQAKSTSSPTGAVVIAVAGSGRGPLVSRALHAAEITGVDVEVWAVEKNPNAYVLLQRTNRDIWNNQVTVVKSDMRSWKGPFQRDGTIGKVDILVSELLGSFADNELSPECLDGVQHVLNPVDGISIPSSYGAFLTPIATPRLFSEISTKSFPEQNPFEMPYVVMLHAYDFLSYDAFDSRLKNNGADPTSLMEPALAMKPPIIQEAWTFSHPQSKSILLQSGIRRGGSAAGGGGGPTGGDGANAHNNRFCQLRFPCPDRGVCHGLAGYFETMLYAGIEEEDGDVELSTNPLTMERKSKDMISWFPIFFPLRTPISFPDNTELVVSFWRQTDDRKVWYEWMVEAFLLHNGSRLRLSVSELHSSKKNGCLM